MKDPKLYTDAYQLGLSLFYRTKSFSKHLRPTLGRSIEEAALSLIFATKRAMFSGSESRIKHLHKVSDILDDIRILLQLSRDLEMLSVGGYGELSELTKEIGRELGGILKHEKRKNPHRESQ